MEAEAINKIKEYKRRWHIANAEKVRNKAKKWREDNPEKYKQQMKKWAEENSDKIKKDSKKYRENHKKEAKKYAKKYQQENKIKLRKYQKKWMREKLQNDPVFRLNNNMRRDIGRSLKGNKNGQKWESLVGYDTKQLKEHLEIQFKNGMNWDNYGKWHIDHKIPTSLFNITSEKCKGFLKCWALENLQPLWDKDNFSKRDKLFVL